MKPFKSILTVLVFIFLINSVYAISYSGAYPVNGSIIYNTDIDFTIDYVEVTNISVLNGTSYISINKDNNAGWINYTLIDFENTTANYSWRSPIYGDVLYKWYLNDSGNNMTESGEYAFSIGIFTSVVLIFAGVANTIGGFLSIIIAVIPVILIIVVVGMLKGWFKKGGILDFRGMLKNR